MFNQSKLIKSVFTTEGFYLTRRGQVGKLPQTDVCSLDGKLKRNVMSCYMTKTQTGNDHISQNCVSQYV